MTNDTVLDEAIELAYDLDVYFRQHSTEYESIYSEVQETQEGIADNLLAGKTDKIKGFCAEIGMTSNSELYKRIIDFEKQYLQNKGPFSVLVTNTETQAEGWLSLPAESDMFDNLLENIGLSKGDEPKMYSVSDYVITYGDLSDYISKGENIDELNYLASLLENFDDRDIETFIAAVECDGGDLTAEELINLAMNTEHYNLVEDMYDWDDYGKYLVEENIIEINRICDIEGYINFYQYGKDQAEENGAFLVNDAVLEKGSAMDKVYYHGNTADIPYQCRLTPIETDENFVEDKLKRSMELADNLDRFFTEFDRDYAEKYPNGIMTTQLCDNLYNGKTDNIKEMLADLGQGDSDVLPGELKEYEDKYIPAKYRIYQLKDTDDTRNFRYESLDYIHSKGGFADKNNYVSVYSAAYTVNDTLEKLYERFNTNIPEGFKGHSLSVSDIVVISKNGTDKAYYCDSVGFREVPEFLNYIQTRSAVYSNYMGYTALVGADDNVYLGKSENYHFKFDAPSYYDNSDNSIIHISDNINMYSFLYGDGWVVSQQEMISEDAFSEKDYKEFAQLKDGVLSKLKCINEITFDGKPFNYLESAEISQEQNYNQIDGQINNEKPSVRQRLKEISKNDISQKEHKPPDRTEPER